jgi:DUF2075 family protein
MKMVATEFKVQGLELDIALLAWGTDFLRDHGVWSDALATRHKNKVTDSLTLRLNAYRVLLTRGRDGTVIYVPACALLDETFEWLCAQGVRRLDAGRNTVGTP